MTGEAAVWPTTRGGIARLASASDATASFVKSRFMGVNQRLPRDARREGSVASPSRERTGDSLAGGVEKNETSRPIQNLKITSIAS